MPPRTDTPNDESKWQAQLAGETVELVNETPHYGFFRMRERKGGPLVPVAFWYSEAGDLRCKVDGIMVDQDAALQAWSRACDNAVTHEEYQRVAAGGRWSDIDGAVHDQINGREQIGGNNPPDDPAVLLKDELEALQRSAAQYTEINDDETLKRARSLHALLLEKRLAAVKAHKKEKDPHLEAGRLVDRKWFPLRDMADAAANVINLAMDAFATKKLKAQRRAEAEARAKVEAEARAKAAAEPPPPSSAAPTEAPPPAPAPAAPAPIAPIKGAHGRAANVAVVNVITDVNDWDALYATFKERDEVRALLRKLADQAVRLGQSVPGVTIEEQAKVRG
jgi:hypothetical protein